MKKFDNAMRRGSDRPNEQPVVLTVVYYAEPDFSRDDAIREEIVRHGGEETHSNKCLCCNCREINALFGDRHKALDAGESLEANWDAEVEIRTLGKACGGCRRRASKATTKPVVKAKKHSAQRKAPGILPSPQWLKDNGYGGLVEAMRKNPEAFSHIEQAAD